MIENIILDAKKASKKLAIATTEEKNNALKEIAKILDLNRDKIIEENKLDLEESKDKLNASMYKRLQLDNSKIDGIIKGIEDVIMLEDPIGEIIDEVVRPNGLKIEKVRVPLGVIAAIFESRPNVAVDIAALTIKTGNACILKGGSEAKHTNTFLVNLMKKAINQYIPSDSIELVLDRNDTIKLLTNKNVDLVVPRGSKNLIKFVVENAKVPYIETGAGVCHLYIDKVADDEMAINILKNAKTSNPSVCNAVETLLINESKTYLLPKIREVLSNVELRGNEEVSKYIKVDHLMNEDDYDTEYDDLILSIKIVKNVDEAILHIDKHSTHHSEAIISNDNDAISRFLNKIDSACVYVNASTRFTDGGCFGFGAELGISTQKLHARGPMGLKEMTSYKYKIYGNGQIRWKKLKYFL